MKPAAKSAAGAALDTPETLDGEALLEWHRITRELEAAGTLAKCDRAAVTLYCQTWAHLQDALRNIESTGTIIKLPNGYPGPTPYLKVYQQCAALCTRLLTELGATPGARARIPRNPTDDDAADELEI